MTQNLNSEFFHQLNINDEFFNSLISDYNEFPEWFKKKANEKAFTFYSDHGKLEGFLYLKIEKEPCIYPLPAPQKTDTLKIGTFKINPHGTRLGERFLKRIFDIAITYKIEQIYVTIFPKHWGLIELFQKYGFQLVGEKESQNGTEDVYLKSFNFLFRNLVQNYPKIPIVENRHFILSIHPQWHSRLLPDSLLRTENTSILQDVSHTNSIHKIYLTSMSGVNQLTPGDTLIIYRTASGGSAYYTSVVTSICVVEEFRHISTFSNLQEFINYCSPYSIFNENELKNFYYTKKYPYIIRFTYNMALKKRLNRKLLIEEIGIQPDMYWGFFQITTDQLKKILTLSEDYEKSSTLVYTP